MMFRIRFMRYDKDYRHGSDYGGTILRSTRTLGPFVDIMLDGEHLLAQKENRDIRQIARFYAKPGDFTRKWILRNGLEFTNWRIVPYVPKFKAKPIKRRTIVMEKT